VHIADLNERIQRDPRKYLWDEIHPTRAGVSLMINVMIEAAQPCFAPAAPADLVAERQADGKTEVTWSPTDAGAAAGGGSVSYMIERSDGTHTNANETRTTLEASGASSPQRVRVRARTAAAVTPWSDWVDVAGPNTAGKRWLPAIPLLVGALAIAGVLVVQDRMGKRSATPVVEAAASAEPSLHDQG
jgi:hypothetical protein